MTPFAHSSGTTGGPELPFERVHSVTHFRDAPREGVAHYRGVPHVFRSVHRAPLDDWDADRFYLSPITHADLALVHEDWAIWERFVARYREEVAPTPDDQADYGALADDLPRFRELRRLLARLFALDPSRCIVAHGEFRARFADDASPENMEPVLDVRWSDATAMSGDVLLPSPTL